MGEPRHLLAQRLEQEDVLGRVAQVILAPDDMADPHRRVVDHDGEVVQRRAVAADDHEVAAEVGHVDLDPAADQVVEPDDTLADPEAERRPAALGREHGALRLGQSGAASAVARWQSGRLQALALGIELVGRAETGVGHVGRAQAVGGRGVQRQTLHLAVWGVWAAGFLAGHSGPLVPGQTQPVEPVQDVLLIGQRRSGDISIFEAQDERPANVPGEQEVEQGGPGRPDVERTGRARGDPDARRDRRQDRLQRLGHRVGAGGTRWNRAGSASPGRIRMSAAGRSPRVARPRGPSRVSESSEPDRARMVMWAPGVSARASR